MTLSIHLHIFKLAHIKIKVSPSLIRITPNLITDKKKQKTPMKTKIEKLKRNLDQRGEWIHRGERGKLHNDKMGWG